VHGTLLRLAFPIFTDMELKPGATIIVAEHNSSDIKIMLELAYSQGRCCK
jgi:hypothetical protein